MFFLYERGNLPDDSKYSVIESYPTPKDADSAKRFVAFCNYYRRFIKNFSEYSRHLTRLSKKGVPFEWTEDCEFAFKYLKKALISPTLLQYPDFTKEFCITTDASKHACGAVLTQEHQGKQLPIAYASKTFTKGESNKSTIEQELTAIHWAITHFRPYFYGKHFLIRTDHRPLSYLFSMKNPSSKLTRMRLDLEEYDFTVEYLRGKDNYVADALSRITIDDFKEMNRKVACVLRVTTRSVTKQKDSSRINNQYRANKNDKLDEPKIYVPIKNSDVRKYYKLKIYPNKCYIKKGKSIVACININDIFTKEKLDLGQFFSRLEKAASKLNIKKLQVAPSEKIFEFISKSEFRNMGNKVLNEIKIALLNEIKILYTKNSKEILEIMLKYHDDPIEGGHCGIYRTAEKIKRYYYWKNMTKDIAKDVKACHKCQIAKNTKRIKGPMIVTETPNKPFDPVYVDTIEPSSRSIHGNKYAVTLICDLTKYLVTIPIPNKLAKTKAIWPDEDINFGHGYRI